MFCFYSVPTSTQGLELAPAMLHHGEPRARRGPGQRPVRDLSEASDHNVFLEPVAQASHGPGPGWKGGREGGHASLKCCWRKGTKRTATLLLASCFLLLARAGCVLF